MKNVGSTVDNDGFFAVIMKMANRRVPGVSSTPAMMPRVASPTTVQMPVPAILAFVIARDYFNPK